MENDLITDGIAENGISVYITQNFEIFKDKFSGNRLKNGILRFLKRKFPGPVYGYTSKYN